MKKALQPTSVVRPFDKTNVAIAGFGRNGGKTNWKALVDHNIHCSPEDRARMTSAVTQLLNSTKASGKILAPRTGGFNAVVCEPDDLHPLIITLDKETSLLRGENAEGVIVPRKTAAAFFPADCNTVIARAESGRLIAAHAGGFSLIDRVAAVSGVDKSREFASVVDAVIASFGELRDAPETLSVFIVRGVRHSNFGYDPRDKAFGERNQKLLAAFRAIDPSVVSGESGSVDITHAIRLQLERHGVPGHRIQTDTTDTHNDRDFGDFLWWSHERAKANGDVEESANCRNLIMVINA